MPQFYNFLGITIETAIMNTIMKKKKKKKREDFQEEIPSFL